MRFTLHNIIFRPGTTRIRKKVFPGSGWENLLELKNPGLRQYGLNARNERTRNPEGSKERRYEEVCTPLLF